MGPAAPMGWSSFRLSGLSSPGMPGAAPGLPLPTLEAGPSRPGSAMAMRLPLPRKASVDSRFCTVPSADSWRWSASRCDFEGSSATCFLRRCSTPPPLPSSPGFSLSAGAPEAAESLRPCFCSFESAFL
jgi:hypothetical protein